MITRLSVERWWPLAAGVSVAGSWWGLCLPAPGEGAHTDIFGTTMSLASITVGFLATAMSIVVSSPDSPLQLRLAESSYVEDLIRYLEEPFVAGILLGVLCMVGFVLPACAVGSIAFWAAWAGLSAWMVAGLLRIGRIFVHLMRAIARERVAQQRAKVAQARSAPLPPLD